MTSSIDLKEIVQELQREREEHIRELNKKEHKIATLSARIDELTMKLNQQATLRAQARNLYNEIDNRIMTKLNTKGAPKQQSQKKHPVLQTSTDDSLGALRRAAYEYDIAEFFAYRRKEHKVRLTQPYRTIAKIYRTSRDVGHKSASVGIRLIKKAKR